MATETDKDTRYNGWTNYETWAVNLWITNDQGSYDYATELAETAWEDAEDHGPVFTRPELARIRLADALKEWTEEAMYDWEGPTCMFTDLLHSAFSVVDWFELADTQLSNVEDYTRAS